MTCPKCEHPKSVVIESRFTEGVQLRKRECLKCGHWFKTQEVPYDGQIKRAREKKQPTVQPPKLTDVSTDVFNVWR